MSGELTGDCSIDCLERCAYPGQFSECWVEDTAPPCATCRGIRIVQSPRDTPPLWSPRRCPDCTTPTGGPT